MEQILLLLTVFSLGLFEWLVLVEFNYGYVAIYKCLFKGVQRAEVNFEVVVTLGWLQDHLDVVIFFQIRRCYVNIANQMYM